MEKKSLRRPKHSMTEVVEPEEEQYDSDSSTLKIQKLQRKFDRVFTVCHTSERIHVFHQRM
jgi:hypothetical protein